MFRYCAIKCVDFRFQSGHIDWLRTVLLALFATLFLATPAVQAAGCVEFDFTDGGFDYLDFGGGNFLSGTISTYRDSNCETPGPSDYSAPYGLAYASTGTQAAIICQANNSGTVFGVREQEFLESNVFKCFATGEDGNRDENFTWEPQTISLTTVQAHSAAEALRSCRIRFPEVSHVYEYIQTYWHCFIVIGGGSGSGGGRGGRAGFRDIPNFPLTGLKLRAFDGANTGIQFRRLTQYYIGIQSVLDMGVLDAVDVWSNIGSGYEVCFPGPGRVVFLDAATSPRTEENMSHYFDDAYTCATSDRAGTMVLVELEAGTTGQPTSTSHPTPRRPGTNDSIDSAIELEDCEITPRFNLRLRETPWGRILDVIPLGETVDANARTKSWFKVAYLEQEGWSAAWLADSEGECDWPAETESA